MILCTKVSFVPGCLLAVWLFVGVVWVFSVVCTGCLVVFVDVFRVFLAVLALKNRVCLIFSAFFCVFCVVTFAFIRRRTKIYKLFLAK